MAVDVYTFQLRNTPYRIAEGAVAAATLTAGTLIAHEDLIGIVNQDTAITETFGLIYQADKIVLPIATVSGSAVVAGDRLYFDEANNQLTQTATTDIWCAIALEPAALTEVEVTCYLDSTMEDSDMLAALATNTAGIATNVTDIGDNVTDIATNVSDILANTALANDVSKLHVHTQVVTTSELNANEVLVAGVVGRTYTIHGFRLAFAGAFATLTDVRISDTFSTEVDAVTVAVAAIGSGGEIISDALVIANVTIGAGFDAALTVDEGIQLRKTGSDGTVGTAVTVSVFYTYTDA